MVPDDERLRAVLEAQPARSAFLGIEMTNYSPDRIGAELEVREEMAIRSGLRRGGAIVSFADNLGGTAVNINLPAGAMTTNVGSKTNFLRPVPLGHRANDVRVPLHRRRITSVWHTGVHGEDLMLAAVVPQIQVALRRDPEPTV